MTNVLIELKLNVESLNTATTVDGTTLVTSSSSSPHPSAVTPISSAAADSR